MALVIRSAVPADVDAIIDVYVASWNFRGLFPSREVTPDLTRRWAEALAAPLPLRWRAAEVDRAVVGVAGIGASRDPIDPALGELDTIAVARTHWRRGVGRALMGVAVRHLRADGYAAAILWTLKGLSRAELFYRQLERRPEHATRDGGRQVRYRLDLSRP